MGGSKLPRPFNYWTTYPGHSGIDYPEARGTKIPALGSGKVAFAGYYSLRGGYAVHVQYDNGVKVGCYHIDKQGDIKVKVGQRVNEGTTLALVGGLGQYSTGPHLHQDVWINGSIVYPPGYWRYIDINKYVGQGESAAGESTPLEPELLEEDMLFISWENAGSKFCRVWGTGLQKMTQAQAAEWNKARGGGKIKFTKVSLATAKSVLDDVRSAAIAANNGVANAVSREIDEMLDELKSAKVAD